MVTDPEAEALALKLDVTIGRARQMLRSTYTPDEWNAREERRRAFVEMVRTDAVASIDADDLEDFAESADPVGELRSEVADRTRRTMMTATELSMRGAIAAHTSWANTADRTARTAPGREAFNARFERQVDPDGVLPEAERIKRAENARKAHFARMALKSAQARRRKAEQRKSPRSGE